MTNDLLTPPQVAEILGLKVQTLALWRLHRKELPFLHVGRLVRYRRQAVEDWLQKRTVAAVEVAG